MLHGINAHFYPGTVAYLSNLQDAKYVDEACELQRFVEKEQRWEIRLRHPRFDGKCILVEEHNINLAYCILPDHAIRPLEDLSPSGTRLLARPGICGMGIASLEPCFQGQILLEEYPFLLSGADESSVWRTRCRWQAFLAMQAQARVDERMRVALQSFEKLSLGSWSDDRKREFQEEAIAIFTSLCEEQPGLEARPWLQDAIMQVLMVWQSNQFSFDNGSGRKSSALYRLVCMMNHSCRPNVSLKGAFDTSHDLHGCVTVRALCDLHPGEELCHNFGPQDLTTWSLSQRQEFLLRVHGFECRCSRCNEEQIRQQAETEEGPSLLMSMD